MAAACVKRALSQAAADILAFLLLQSDLSAAIKETAEDMFADLEGRICPRIVYDAREFAAAMDIIAMLEYIRDLLDCEPNLTLAQRPSGSA